MYGRYAHNVLKRGGPAVAYAFCEWAGKVGRVNFPVNVDKQLRPTCELCGRVLQDKPDRDGLFYERKG